MDRELERRWVRQWAETGKLLDAMRRQALRELSPERRLRIIEDVLSIPVLSETPEYRRRSSGLVEQQDLFRKLRVR